MNFRLKLATGWLPNHVWFVDQTCDGSITREIRISRDDWDELGRPHEIIAAVALAAADDEPCPCGVPECGGPR